MSKWNLNIYTFNHKSIFSQPWSKKLFHAVDNRSCTAFEQDKFQIISNWLKILSPIKDIFISDLRGDFRRGKRKIYISEGIEKIYELFASVYDMVTTNIYVKDLHKINPVKVPKWGVDGLNPRWGHISNWWALGRNNHNHLGAWPLVGCPYSCICSTLMYIGRY